MGSGERFVRADRVATRCANADHLPANPLLPRRGETEMLTCYNVYMFISTNSCALQQQLVSIMYVYLYVV